MTTLERAMGFPKLLVLIPHGDSEYGKVEYKVLPGNVDVILHDVTNNLHCQIEDGVFVRLHRLSCVNNKHQRRVYNLVEYYFGLNLYEYLSGIHTSNC